MAASPNTSTLTSPKKKDESLLDKIGTLGRKKKVKEAIELQEEGKNAIESPTSPTSANVGPEGYLLEENEERSMIEPASRDDPKVKELVKLLLEWINDVLADDRIIVKDIEEDLFDGQILQKLIEKLADVRVEVAEVSQSEMGQKQKLRVILDVINRILSLPQLGTWNQQKWSVDSVHSKNLIAILHLLVALARHFRAPIRLPENVQVFLLVVQEEDYSSKSTSPERPVRGRGRGRSRGARRAGGGRGRGHPSSRSRGRSRSRSEPGRADEALRHIQGRQDSMKDEINQMSVEECRKILLHVLEKTPTIMIDIMRPAVRQPGGYHPGPDVAVPEWCVCIKCREMPTANERVCCGKENCVSLVPKRDGMLQPRRVPEEITGTNEDVGGKFERDAFDTLFDHAPDKLNLVKKTLVTFVNKQLLKVNLEVSDIHTQFHDGVYLVLLMGLLEGYFVPLHSFHLTPSEFEQKVHNVGFAFELMQDAGLPKPKARAEDVVNLDLKCTLRVLYNIFTKYKDTPLP